MTLKLMCAGDNFVRFVTKTLLMIVPISPSRSLYRLYILSCLPPYFFLHSITPMQSFLGC